MGLFNKRKNKDEVSKEQETTFPADVRQEIEDALHFCIYSGFYAADSLFDEACQIFEDICLDNDIAAPSDTYMKQMIKNLAANVKPAETGRNNYLRLRSVFDILNSERIIAIHFAGYTQSDGHEEVGTVFQWMKENHIPRRGYCFYHQQDIERAMDELQKCLFLAFHSMNGDEQIAVEVAERIVELLTEHDFDVEWNHSLNSRIKINNFLWDKTYDGEDYGADRAIRIMGERKPLS